MIDNNTMNRVYERLKTPVKLGAVIKETGTKFCDCVSLFKRDDMWYMMYTGIDTYENPCGYDTFLASSKDLIHWDKLGMVLSRPFTGWDAHQVDGGFALTDIDFGGKYEIHPYDSKYWCTYIGGALPGYETPPLSLGLAYTDNPTVGKEWIRLEKPIMTTLDADARDFEKETLFRPFVFEDKENTLNSRFVMFYNAKSVVDGRERIGIAVSDDFYTWRRYLDNYVVHHDESPDNHICGDPQIIKMERLWVMPYFRFDPAIGGAYDTFAVSDDLVNWTRWTGEPLVKPSETFDDVHAHKPLIVSQNGKTYHFYCACNSAGVRFIALAVSGN